MINRICDFNIDEIIEAYKKTSKIEGSDESELIYYSPNKKDKNADGSTRQFFVNLDNVVRDLVKKYNLKNGFVVCGSKHTTSSVYINHFEHGLMNDELEFLRTLYPLSKKYQHNIWDFEYKNADAHLKAIHLGKSATVIVQNGELVLGDFENIIYVEFDHRRGKAINISLFGEE